MTSKISRRDFVNGVRYFGVCGDAISAYAAKRLTLPGTIPSHELQGNMNMAHAMLEGQRGALQAIDLSSS